ncbi:MAG TPA: hypothetical protein ENK57_01885 [Polyangiaceae bacterium]|nr:hypothetical protein [Polyangiaceae bacterium]
MNKLFPIFAFSTLFATACIDTGSEDLGQVFGAIACDTDADCPSGLECEVEHGEAYCKPHGSNDGTGGMSSAGQSGCQSDSDCPAGQECELEHGTSFCKPHGGAGGDDLGSGGSGDDLGSGGGAVGECLDDSDCPADEECEFEHGTSFCKPHGGA